VISGSTKSIQSVADSDQAMNSPAEPGTYAVTTFNYGSGKDMWQPEFGASTDLISQSVDASAYITNWSKYRTIYLGYDQKELPLNGRVWMPQGSDNETYPLILIVHGNHLMEDHSDAGYAYLGELLASRGFIAVSVDENFLNYSAWTGIPDNDMKVRAWVLLKHLQQIHTFAQSPGTPFYGKVDMNSIALIGHSRGGQAIAMAADYTKWFKSDTTLDNVKQFNIKALAAIAPTDKKVDGMNAKLKDINYLIIQGANDGDVSDFDGDRQYNRTSFTKGTDSFKASLYVQGANHSQFNTDWGLRDISFPTGILLKRDNFLSGVNQRTVAKLYISAFMETSLHGQSRYTSLFRDYHEVLPMLPETTYINQYEDGHFTIWTRFEEDSNRKSLPKNGVADGKNIIWREEETKNRGKSNKGDHALILERSQPSPEESVYSMSWPNRAPQPAGGPPQALSFALADQSKTLEEVQEKANTGSFAVEIELMDRNDTRSRLPLSHFKDFPELSEVQFTLHPWLELHMSNGKFNNPTEAIFQTYTLPMTDFISSNPEFAPEEGIKSISFILIGDQGKIMLDDIGMY
ncbi:MAG TPA: alpha/beta hydrolase, partial [Paenibacillus sp.]